MPGVDESSAAREGHLAPLLQDPHRCRALLAATDAIVWTIDPQRGFVEPQPSWQAYTGQTWDEARGDGWRRAVHPDDEAGLVSAWTLATQRNDRYHGSCRLWHARSATWRRCVVRAVPVMDAQGDVVEWIGAVTDVHDRPMSLTEMQQLNDALKQQLEAHHEELERLFSVSLDVMLTLGTDGRLITVSPSFETMLGIPHAQARGEVFDRFLHPDDVARTWDEVRRVLTGEHQAIDFETRVVRQDGEVRVISWRAVGSATESRLYAIGRDVTERRTAEQQRMRAQRLEAVGQLTGGLAHDFNNILGAMMSFVEVARRLDGDAGRQQQALQSALDAGRRGARLVSQLLTFARKQELSITPTDVNRTIADMRELLARSLGGTLELELSLAEDLGPAWADATQLEQVVLNLCINARDAMPDGGRVAVRTSAHAITGDPRTRRDDLPRGDYLVIEVRDTGTGMDEATLARCFEPFFTTKPAGQGTGLGLPQVLGVAQQCGGTVRVQSAPGQGTSVEVILPRAPAQGVAPLAQGTTRPAPPSLPAGTVLLVDDNPDMLSSTALLLEAFGLDVFTAGGPEEAMGVVLSARPFDVLVSDYAMPGMTGVALVRDALRHRPDLAAVLVTGLSDVTEIRGALPGITLLRKPFEPKELVEAVTAAIDAHRVQTGERQPVPGPSGDGQAPAG